MTQEEIKTEKRILTVLGLALLLIVMASYFNKGNAQDLSQGRIFTRSVMPTGTLPNFVANRDILIVNNQQYYYSGGWKPVTLIRGEKGDKGDTGATGATGADGVCPSCPPTSGGSSTQFNFGVKWAGTTAEWNSALSSTSTRAIYLYNDFTANIKFNYAKNYSKIFLISGNGAKITVTADTLLTRTYASLSEANAGIDMQLRISNVEFVGNGSNVCIAVQAMYGAKIEGCRFSNFKTAYYGGWTMGTVIEQCFFWENNISIDLDYARFSGGSNSASQSNHSVIRDCKFRHSAGQFAAIKATAVSGLVIDHCIFEGVQAGSQYEVYFDDNGSTVVKDFTMTNCHIEQQQSVASVYIRLKDGYAYVSKVFSQYDCNLVKFESAGYAKCVVSGIPYLTSGTKFENVNSAGRWEFLDMPATFDPTVTTWWNGTAPYMPALNSWQTSGQTKYTKNVQVK